MNRPTMTPQFCGQKAEDHIHQYLVEVGAYGDADKVVKALEMLLSKTALGFGMLAGQAQMIDLLLRTSYHAANALEGMGIKPEAGAKPQ